LKITPKGKKMTKRPKILLINGPNLNLLGRRDPEIYGKKTLADIEDLIIEEADKLGFDVECLQSNYEGDLITYMQEVPDEKIRAVILNAGGYTHTSVALRDAVDFARSQGIPTVEVHLSEPKKREKFRHLSYIEDVCIKTFSGSGFRSYIDALKFINSFLEPQQTKPKRQEGKVK
jgi:3-dehydroquinate dehydratase type II